MYRSNTSLAPCCALSPTEASRHDKRTATGPFMANSLFGYGESDRTAHDAHCHDPARDRDRARDRHRLRLPRLFFAGASRPVWAAILVAEIPEIPVGGGAEHPAADAGR